MKIVLIYNQIIIIFTTTAPPEIVDSRNKMEFDGAIYGYVE